MKFSNGAWLMADGVTPFYASSVRDYEITDNQVTIFAPFSPVRHRGDTLTGPLFTLTFTCPLEEVIQVKMIHFKQKPKTPCFDLKLGQLSMETKDTETHILIESGKTLVKISKSDWLIEYFYDGRLLTFSGFRGFGMMDVDQKGRFMVEQLNLTVNEKIYGLGERFSNFIRNGQTVEIWNEDGGTGTEQSYKNIPFYLSNQGYGLLVNDTGKVAFEIGSEKVSRLQFSVEGESIEYLIFPGSNPKEILQKYTAISGLPGLPPAWSFGLWLTTSFTTDYDEATVTSFIDGMAQRDLPLHTFHFDCFWMKEYEWCNFTWDEAVFPDPVNMLKRLKAKGLHICVWINPYIGQKSPLYDIGMEKGYFIKTSHGESWQWDLWQPGMGIVDFTNPEATKWYLGYLENLMDMGVDAFKTDFGERIPIDNVSYFDGSDPKKMHNYYAYMYNEAVYNLLLEKRGEKEAVLFARSASVGSQKFPVHWGGDCTSVYESMAESLRGGLSLCMSGFGFWSHDIGGFESTSTADVYKRWIAFGLLSTHSRLHGSSSYRVPWLYDEESVDVLRHFTKLKCSLMPYLFSQANMTAHTGIPMMRSLFLEYPEDLVAQTIDQAYFLGDNIYVSPVFNEKGDCAYYLPEGTFTHLLTNEVRTGGRYYQENYDYMSLPLYIKSNSVVAFGAQNDVPDYDYLEGITYHLFQLDEKTVIETPVYNTQMELEDTFVVEKEGPSIQLKRTSTKSASVLLRNMTEITSASVAYETTPSGILLILKDQTQAQITL